MKYNKDVKHKVNFIVLPKVLSESTYLAGELDTWRNGLGVSILNFATDPLRKLKEITCIPSSSFPFVK
jgi:hypothetical protein